jgi:twitching motility protein PilU
MSALTEDQARTYMHKLLAAMAAAGGSDLFIANDFPPSMKVDGGMKPMTAQKLTADVTRALADAMMTERQREEFAKELECNFAVTIPAVGRFRINILVQQQCVSLVCRAIAAEIPNFEKLKLPEVLKEVVMAKRGLVLVVGATGSGKSTSLAAMIDHRNRTSAGHIITVEDPVEYVHVSQKSLVTHREVGVDTHSWHHALKNTLRQAPDVILIGEIRDAETMEHAIAFAETGHLCLGTLHANSASQTIERIINFFPEERRAQLLMDLSANLRAIVSQRLVRREDGKGRSAAIEILLNTPTIAEKIFTGRSRELGMCTFDWALFDLYEKRHINFEEAIRNADSANELRLNIKLRSKRGEPSAFGESSLSLDMAEEEAPKLDAVEEQRRKTEARHKAEDEELARMREKKRLAEAAATSGGQGR